MKDKIRKRILRKKLSALAGILVGAIFFIPGFLIWSSHNNLVRTGIEVQATIIEMEHRSGGNSRPVYQFELDGREYVVTSHTETRTSGNIRIYRVGNQVTLVVDPENPYKFTSPAVDNVLPFGFMGLGGFVIIYSAILFLKVLISSMMKFFMLNSANSHLDGKGKYINHGGEGEKIYNWMIKLMPERAVRPTNWWVRYSFTDQNGIPREVKTDSVYNETEALELQQMDTFSIKFNGKYSEITVDEQILN